MYLLVIMHFVAFMNLVIFYLHVAKNC